MPGGFGHVIGFHGEDKMSETDKQIDELRRACMSLFLELPESIAKDFRDKAFAVIDQLKACREILEIAEDALLRCEQRTKKVCLGAAWKWLKNKMPDLLPKYRTEISIAFDKAIEEAK